MRKKVLIIEDTPGHRNKLIQELTGEKYDYEIVNPGNNFHEENILELFKGEQPHIGIFDINLDDTDSSNKAGISLAKMLNQLNPFPTIFISNYHDDEIFNSTRRAVEHSIFCARDSQNWSRNAVRRIDDALEKFSSKNRSLEEFTLINDRLTFREKKGGDNKYGKNESTTIRHFLKKDDIICFTTNKSQGDGAGVKIYTDREEYVIGTHLKNIEKQLTKMHKYNWHFKRVCNYAIVNLERMVSISDQYIKFDQKIGENIIATQAYITDSEFKNYFFALSTSTKVDKR